MTGRRLKYKQTKYDPAVTSQLAIYREDAGLTQDEAAECYGLTGRKRRDSVSNWERGVDHAAKRRRIKFMFYLWDCLQLRQRPDVFVKVWNDVVVGQWGWNSLTDEELWQHLPTSIKQLLPDPSLAPPFLVPPQDFKPVGQQELLKNLKKRLFACESLALYGIPGVGKTTMALALAYDPEVLKRFRDGIVWVGLGEQAAKDDVFRELERWGKALGVAAEEFPKLTDINSRIDALNQIIGSRHVLLIIDDAWDIGLAQDFEVGGHNCAHLLTTRSEEIANDFTEIGAIEVPSLTDPNGQTLLAKITPPLEPEDSAQLIQIVGGLPLSIILMGRYLRMRPIDEALSDLKKAKQRLALKRPVSRLKRSPSWFDERWVTLRAVIELSFKKLRANEKLALQALSAFPANPNSFSEEAGLEVAATTSETLEALVKKYGLVQTSGDRYMLHQTIADFAAERLTDQAAFENLANYFVKYSEAHSRDYDILDIEVANTFAALRAASDIGMNETLLRGANAFSPFMETRGLYESAVQYLTKAEKAARGLNDIPRLIKILSDLGTAHIKQGETEKAEQFYQEGLVYAEEIEDHKNIIILTINLASLAGNRSDFDQAKTYFQETLLSAEAINDQHRICDTLQNLATVAIFKGDLDEADRILAKSLKLARQINYLERLDMLLGIGASIEDKRGNKRQAEIYLLEGLDVAEKLGYQEHIATILANLGALAINQQDYASAEDYLQRGLPIAEKIGHRETVCRIDRNLGELFTKLGNYQMAQDYLERALNIAQEIQHGFLIYSTLILQGKLDMVQRRLQLASNAFEQALEMAVQAGDKETIARATRGLAQIAEADSDLVRAHNLAKKSLELFEAIGHEEASEVAEWLDTLPQPEPKTGSGIDAGQ